jgi:hypothetical protein
LELEGFATFFRGLMQALSMAVDPARTDLETAIALHRRANNRVGEGMTLATLGLTFLKRELLEQALAIHTPRAIPGERDTDSVEPLVARGHRAATQHRTMPAGGSSSAAAPCNADPESARIVRRSTRGDSRARCGIARLRFA